ncbi:hypothetical protein DPMN_182228 [Dreissena polymorpha]|uniref:Uncharacterized protein n=1 Tax=Dreissena polymorpha TaxID=45954 RepID=A0A9D4DF75_DREPO|nr:hypothetical protein DPMN_182228 [Dreissena polymorpha]
MRNLYLTNQSKTNPIFESSFFAYFLKPAICLKELMSNKGIPVSPAGADTVVFPCLVHGENGVTDPDKFAANLDFVFCTTDSLASSCPSLFWLSI